MGSAAERTHTPWEASAVKPITTSRSRPGAHASSSAQVTNPSACRRAWSRAVSEPSAVGKTPPQRSTLTRVLTWGLFHVTKQNKSVPVKPKAEPGINTTLEQRVAESNPGTSTLVKEVNDTPSTAAEKAAAGNVSDIAA